MQRMSMLLLVITCINAVITTPTFAQVGEWVRKADMPTARYAMAAAVLDGNIYVIGGWNREYLKTVEMYDPRLDKWETKADLSQGNLGVAAATVNGKIYAIGGWDGANTFATVEEYSPTTDTWIRKANMPTSRNWVSAAVVDGVIYAISGYSTVTNAITSAVEAYDPVADQWNRKASLPFPAFCQSAAVGGKIYAMGFNINMVPRHDVYEYDPVMDTWTKKADMPTTRMVISAVAVNGKIYAIGGLSSHNPFIKVPTMEIYDPDTDLWEEGVDLPDARAYHVSAAIDGRIYIIGGVDAWSNINTFPDLVLSTVEVFDTGLPVPSQDRLATVWGSVKNGR